MYPRRRGSGLGVLLLAAQILNTGIENIPPVTLALIAGQTAIFLNLFPLLFYSASSVCLSTYLVWHKQDYKRLILSQFYHVDDMHLYFNMASLLIKGKSLERRFGSVYFLWMVSVFTPLTGIVFVTMNLILEDRLYDQSYATQCAVGFSGVIFALKVVTTHYTPAGLHFAMGYFPVPSRMIYWVELLLIQLVSPNVSFTGHLAGILVGVLYVKGPLKPVMNSIIAPLPGPRSSYFNPFSWFSSDGNDNHTRWPFFGGSSGKNDNHTGNLYTDDESEDQYRHIMEESQWDKSQQNSEIYPDLAELKARRAAWYN